VSKSDGGRVEVAVIDTAKYTEWVGSLDFLLELQDRLFEWQSVHGSLLSATLYARTGCSITVSRSPGYLSTSLAPCHRTRSVFPAPIFLRDFNNKETMR